MPPRQINRKIPVKQNREQKQKQETQNAQTCIKATRHKKLNHGKYASLLTAAAFDRTVEVFLFGSAERLANNERIFDSRAAIS